MSLRVDTAKMNHLKGFLQYGATLISSHDVPMHMQHAVDACMLILGSPVETIGWVIDDDATHNISNV